MKGLSPGPDDWEDSSEKAKDMGARAGQETGSRFVAAAELLKEPVPEYVVEDLIPRGGITVLAGEPGAGKSFAALSLAAAIASGAGWHGRKTIAGSVAYVAFEADALPLRLQALQRHVGAVENVYFFRACDPISPLLQRDGVEVQSFGEDLLAKCLQQLATELVAQGRPPIVAVIIDTVRASLSGSEDSSESVAAYLRAVRRILRAIPGAAALLIHHAGWQDGETRRKRERGSSAFRGNVEVTLYLDTDGGSEDGSEVRLVLRILKSRDSSNRAPVWLVRRRIDVPGFDRWRNPLSSCVIVGDTRTKEDRESEVAAVRAEEDRSLDLEVLRVIQKFPDVTSRSGIRSYVRANKERVFAAVTRVLRAGLALEGKRGAPFALTSQGEGVLAASGGNA